MFETVIITRTYLELFAALDPFDFLRFGGMPDRVCLGTVIKGEQDEKDDPVGLMICRKTEAGIVVEWLFTDPLFRDQGVGSDLMRRAFEESEKRGFSKLYAYISDDDRREEVCPGEEDFLLAFGLKSVSVSRENAGIFTSLIPEEEFGAMLYEGDVDYYFRTMEDIILLDDPFFAVKSE